MIVCPELRGQPSSLDLKDRQEEARGLAEAIGIDVVDVVDVPVRKPRPDILIGAGQVEKIALDCEREDVELVIFDASLTPVQQRNLEERLSRKVIDRTGLILEIFGERAATAEGRLQVELAHLDYQQGRLVRSWTHLERQRGGFGFLGGPGETQIEADRRMIRQRMAKLRRELEQVRKTRALHRERRGRAPWPVIALVGYTNAGKSTLFNRLTGADVMAQDMLFATLDPTMRAISLPGIDKAIISDTVGFISDLPTQLVAAFRATLEEVTNADLILHVRDMANPAREVQKAEVHQVLVDLGIMDPQNESTAIPIVEVWSKADLLDGETRRELADLAHRRDDAVLVSAVSGSGIESLLEKCGAMLNESSREVVLTLGAGEGMRLAWLHAHGQVLAEEEVEVGEGEPLRRLRVKLNPKALGQYEALASDDLD